MVRGEIMMNDQIKFVFLNQNRTRRYIGEVLHLLHQHDRAITKMLNNKFQTTVCLCAVIAHWV